MKKIKPILINMLIILLTSFTFTLSAKVLLLTYCYNRPELIELQYKTFKKFLIDDYELIVINDAKTPDMIKKICDTCTTYNLTCINVPQEIHERPYLDRPSDGRYFITNPQSPCVRNCNVVQYSLDILGFNHTDVVALFDSDLFLIKEFSISEYLKGYDLAGFDRSIEYVGLNRDKSFLWIGLIFLNIPSMKQNKVFNLNCGYVDGITLDSGGYSNYYLDNIQPQVHYFERIWVDNFICQNCTKEKSYRCTHNSNELMNLGFDQKTIQFIQDTPIDWGSGSNLIGMTRGRNLEFFLNNHFVHYQGASNYAPQSSLGIDMKQFHFDKTSAFTSFINTILN